MVQKRKSLIYARIHTHDYDRIKKCATEQGITLSELIRRIVNEYSNWWELENTSSSVDIEQEAEIVL